MRMFVAVWPDDGMLQRLSLLDLGRAPGLRLVRPDQWHVTLRFLGEVDEDMVPPLVTALRGAAAQFESPVVCKVGPATRWFSNGRVLKLPVSGLAALAEAVRGATEAVVPDATPAETRFIGHLTLARAARQSHAAARLGVSGLPFSASLRADCFDLVASEKTAQGQTYATRARFVLGQPAES